MADRNQENIGEESGSSTIEQPKPGDTQPTEKPSQAEGDRETVDEDLQGQEPTSGR